MVFAARAVILTTGTFLQGLDPRRRPQHAAGRAGDFAAIGPVAIASRSSASARPAEDRHAARGSTAARSTSRASSAQPGDDPPPPFSFRDATAIRAAAGRLPSSPTPTPRTHEIIRPALDRSPLYNGTISSRGPRYCPSIEDKVVRFADKERHQIFLEPEGLDTVEVYPNGISTSLPLDVQLAIVRTIPGLERAEMMRPGYAVEYDFVDPTQLQPTLETQAAPRPVPRRPDQRHHRLRGGGGAGADRRHQRRAGRARASAADRPRAATRPTSACWSTIWSPSGDAASRTGCSPRAPSTGCCCARTTPTCASADSAGRSAWLDAATRAAVERKRAAIDRETARFASAQLQPPRLLQPHWSAGHGADPRADEPGHAAAAPGARLRGRRLAVAGVARRRRRGRRCPGRDRDQIRRLCRAGRSGRSSARAGWRRRFSGGARLPGDPRPLERGPREAEAVRPRTLGQASRIAGITPAALSLLAVHLRRAGHA